MDYFLHSLEELLVIVFADLMKLQLWSGHRVSKWCCFDVVRFVMTFREMEIGMIVVFCILMDRWSCLGVGEALNASSPVSCVGETKPSAAFLGALCWQGSWLKKRSRAVAWEGWQKLGKPCSRRKTWIFVDLRERTQWRRKDRGEVKWGRPVLDEIRTWKTRPSWKGNEQTFWGWGSERRNTSHCGFSPLRRGRQKDENVKWIQRPGGVAGLSGASSVAWVRGQFERPGVGAAVCAPSRILKGL